MCSSLHFVTLHMQYRMQYVAKISSGGRIRLTHRPLQNVVMHCSGRVVSRICSDARNLQTIYKITCSKLSVTKREVLPSVRAVALVRCRHQRQQLTGVAC